MKIHILIVFVLVICGCSAMFRIPTSIGALRNQLHDILTGNSQCAKNQTRLNADCMMAVVDQMDFPTLLAMAETSHFFSQYCAISFRKRFSDHKIIIYNYSQFVLPKFVSDGVDVMKKALKRFPIVKPSAKEFRLKIGDEYIIFDSVHMALKTLRIFGNVIRKLKLSFSNADTIESIAIIRYVDKYCTDSLIELELDTGGSNVLEHISKPFKKVEHVSFQGHLPSKEQTIPINQIFPALRSISFKLYTGDESYLRYHFPHLESLDIEILNYQADVDYVTGLISENPQIKSVTLIQYQQDTLDMLSMMPQLEHFTFTWWEFLRSEVTFRNVTKFTTGDHVNVDPIGLHFPKLIELEMHFYSSKYENWLEFLDAHRNLKQLHFHIQCMQLSTDDQFKGLTSILKNLEETFVYSKSAQSIAVDTIIYFIDTHEQLKKLHLEQCNDADKETLQSRFSGEWTITKDRNGLSLERKQ